jgi:pseudouridine-5'-phosphate glycosidase
MTSVIQKAIQTLSKTVNVSTGLAHPNDKNMARELLSILHKNGVILVKSEIVDAALKSNWKMADAEELGTIGQQIGDGQAARVKGGPWWAADLFTRLTQ